MHNNSWQRPIWICVCGGCKDVCKGAEYHVLHFYKHVRLEEGCSGWVCHLSKMRQEQAHQQT